MSYYNGTLAKFWPVIFFFLDKVKVTADNLTIETIQQRFVELTKAYKPYARAFVWLSSYWYLVVFLKRSGKPV